nr:Calcium/calmodulin-dependent protein kinase [Ipomoea batatas]GME01007.1 Calcium/calmodulin-dependent protein kinase [Ipomoea batatas]
MSSLQSHLFDEEEDGSGQQSPVGSHDDHVTDSPGGSFFDDHPPESFWLSREDSEHEHWFYRNAATVQRKASRKLTFSGGPGHRRKSSLASSSDRKRNLSLLALPAAQKSRTAADGIFRRDNKVGLFRSRSDPGGKAAVPPSEPGSPVVTCTGRVRTRKGGGGKTGLVKWFGSVLKNRFGKNRVSSKASTG